MFITTVHNKHRNGVKKLVSEKDPRPYVWDLILTTRCPVRVVVKMV